MPATLQDLTARQEVEDLVVRMFVATDERDWATLEGCLADPFVLDMTSLAGGEPASVSPRQVADAWADGFKTLDHVHHQVGNFRTRVAAATATVRCYGIALHHRARVAPESRTRRFVGTYEIDLARAAHAWRITRLKFLLKFIDGNLALESAS